MIVTIEMKRDEIQFLLLIFLRIHDNMGTTLLSTGNCNACRYLLALHTH